MYLVDVEKRGKHLLLQLLLWLLLLLLLLLLYLTKIRQIHIFFKQTNFARKVRKSKKQTPPIVEKRGETCFITIIIIMVITIIIIIIIIVLVVVVIIIIIIIFNKTNMVSIYLLQTD